jgi:hypothetical protein
MIVPTRKRQPQGIAPTDIYTFSFKTVGVTLVVTLLVGITKEL